MNHYLWWWSKFLLIPYIRLYKYEIHRGISHIYPTYPLGLTHITLYPLEPVLYPHWIQLFGAFRFSDGSAMGLPSPTGEIHTTSTWSQGLKASKCWKKWGVRNQVKIEPTMEIDGNVGVEMEALGYLKKTVKIWKKIELEMYKWD